MPSVETVIIAVWIAAIGSVVVGAYGVMREWAKAAAPKPQPYRGRHWRPAPPWWARVGAALADGWREAAATQALLRGEPHAS